VVVHRDAEGFRHVDDRLGHVDAGARGHGIARAGHEKSAALLNSHRGFASCPEISYIERPMNRNQAIAKLKRHAEAIKALGATSLYVFGSVARDEAKARSDLDLFIDYDPDGKFSLLELVG